MNSVKYNFIMLKNEMESYVRKILRTLMGVVEIKNCQNHPLRN
jgi:hypothetical protein